MFVEPFCFSPKLKATEHRDILLHFSFIQAGMLQMVTTDLEITKFRLFGEKAGDLAPEFVHVEPIATRSSLYEWNISPHAHPGIVQLLLVMQGQGILADGACEVALMPGTLAVVPAGTVHAFRFVPGTQGWVLSLAEALLDDPRLANFAAGTLLRGGGQALPLAQCDLATALFATLNSRGPAPDSTTLAILALLLAMAEETAARMARPDGPPDRRLALVRRFAALVEAQFRKHWSVSAYASALATTPQTLTRACRQVLDKAPGDVVQDRILREAMRLLTFTAAGVSQVAQDLGYADPAYFSRFFKSRTGVEPSRFKRERAWLR